MKELTVLTAKRNWDGYKITSRFVPCSQAWRSNCEINSYFQNSLFIGYYFDYDEDNWNS
jgi:hypothetical protein